MTTIHHYSEHTGEYLGSGTADRCQITGVALLPYCATPLAPPKTKAHQAAIFKGAAWSVVADLRGAQYWLSDGSEHTINRLGETLPENALTEPPPPETI